jgi:transposase
LPGATPSYPPKFERDAVRLVRSSPNMSVAHIARELGVSDNSLRNWGKQTEVEQVEWEGLATEECEELGLLNHPQRRLADRLGIHRLTYAKRLDGGYLVGPGIEPLNTP